MGFLRSMFGGYTSFNSFKVLLERKVNEMDVSDVVLSILLKSYWNLRSRISKSKSRDELSILLKSYWNRYTDTCISPCTSLSILLKSYWNDPNRSCAPYREHSFNSFKVLLEPALCSRALILYHSLSILLKSYWNVFAPNNAETGALAFNSFKVLLERSTALSGRVTLSPLSILLKSYWNSHI